LRDLDAGQLLGSEARIRCVRSLLLASLRGHSPLASLIHAYGRLSSPGVMRRQ
jgi:hypothetical protein